MRLGTLLIVLVVASCALAEVTLITNQEFFYLVKDHVEDLESFDIDDPAINDDDDDDSNVIELPGNADDKLDIKYLMARLNLADIIKNSQKRSPKTANNNLGWIHFHFHWHRRSINRGKTPCFCRGSSRSCCLNHTFKVNLWNKQWRFRVNGGDAMNLLENLETTVENKETGQFGKQSDSEESDDQFMI